MFDFSLSTMVMTFLAGMMSVASPCVLPVVPIVVTGTEVDHRFRPVLIVAGLSVGFIAMGAISSLFGSAIAPAMPVVEKIAGGIVILFGFLMILGYNFFKGIQIFNRINPAGGGRWSGLLLGLALGLIWIPCVGPMLSGVLTLVATEGRFSSGIILLAIYSLGFSIPMLLAGYASQTVRQRLRMVNAHPLAIRVAGGLVLICFGLAILNVGMLELGMTS